MALAVRLEGLAFGLPALNDPDEPLFVLAAIDMLVRHSANPEWFGHPGTTTLYAIAAITQMVAGLGLATGRFADTSAFVAAIYTDPAIIFLPARFFFAICGVVCVWLTWRIGKRLGGARLGAIAALLLAINAVHITYSQVIRTDMQASVFMLMALLFSLSILERGRARDYIGAALCTGLACATKWPAALVIVAPLCAALWQARSDHKALIWLPLLGLMTAVTLFAVSPYLILDYPTALAHLTAEGRPHHLGATGDGLAGNIVWYIRAPLWASFGFGGLCLALIGLVWGQGDARKWFIIILPLIIVLFVATGIQNLRWERWVVPMLPLLTLSCARAVSGLWDVVIAERCRPFHLAGIAVLLAMIVPMAHESEERSRERQNDTRQQASRWLKAHAARGSSIMLEHAGLDLLQQPWTLRFPMGSAGCIDARAALQGEIGLGEVEDRRAGSPVIDLGHVALDRLDTCRTDYLVLTHYDRYRAEAAQYPEAMARYDRLTEGRSLLARFTPRHGVSSGPAVFIYARRSAN